MKNIFKFMGIALMATSLMVACTKDEPADTNTDDTTSTNIQDPQDDPQPQAPANEVTMTWNGESKPVAYMAAVKINNQHYVMQTAETSVNGQLGGLITLMQFLYMDVQIDEAGTTQKMFLSSNEQINVGITFQNGRQWQGWIGDYVPSDVFEEGAYNEVNVATGAEEQRGDYRFLGFNAEPVYTSFDPTTGVASLSLDMTYYSVDEWLELKDAIDPEAADYDDQVANLKYQVTTRKALVLNMNEVQFVSRQQ